MDIYIYIYTTFYKHSGLDDIRLLKIRQECIAEFYEKEKNSKKLLECIENMSKYRDASISLIDLYADQTNYANEGWYCDAKLGSKQNLFNSRLNRIIKDGNNTDGDMFFEMRRENVKLSLDALYRLFSLEKDDFYDSMVEKVGSGVVEWGDDSPPTITQYRELIYTELEESYNDEGDLIEHNPSMGFFADIELKKKTENIKIGDFIEDKYQFPQFTDDEKDTDICKYHITKIGNILGILDINVWDELDQTLSKFDNILFKQFHNYIKINYTDIFSEVKNLRDLYNQMNDIYDGENNLKYNEKIVYYFREFLYFINSAFSRDSEMTEEKKREHLIAGFDEEYNKYFKLLTGSEYTNTGFYNKSLEIKTIVDKLKEEYVKKFINTSINLNDDSQEGEEDQLAWYYRKQFDSSLSELYKEFSKAKIPTIKSQVEEIRAKLRDRLSKLDSSLSMFDGFLEFLKEVEPSVNKVKFTGKDGISVKGLKGLDKEMIANNIDLTPEKPLCLVSGFNSSGKTRFIQFLAKAINMGFTQGFGPFDDMKVGNLSKIAYIDRVVGENTSLSSGQQDLVNRLLMLDAIEDKDFVIINVDEIFSTMDKKYSKAFSTVFLSELVKKGKYAIIVSHNHDFNKEMGENSLVNTFKFDSSISNDGEVTHTYKLVPGVIEDSHGVEVLKSLGILNDIL